jgi:hypothetical protein
MEQSEFKASFSTQGSGESGRMDQDLDLTVLLEVIS